MRLVALVGIALLLALAATGCNRSGAPTAGKGAGDSGLEHITLGLNWFPEPEHGGFYAALVHGYFKEEGLDVEIVQGGVDSPILQQVALGQRTFGVTNADNILFGRAREMPVVAIMAPIQMSPRSIMVHESSGIKSFDDLKNMTLAMSPSQAFYHYLRYRVPLTNVKIVPYPGSVAQFLIDKDFGQQAYVFSEPFAAIEQGGDPKNLMLSDLGFNPYTSLLFASEKTLTERPELARKMVTASRRGWQKYLDSPQETDALIQKLNPAMNPKLLEFAGKAIKPLVLDPVAEKHGIGHMTLDRWRELGEQIIACGQLKPDEVDAAKAFDARFLIEEPEASKPMETTHPVTPTPSPEAAR